MKKILFIILPVLLCTFSVALAQDVQSRDGAANGKKMSFVEANKLNGSKEPTVNGKPYSQHKAEQDAKRNIAVNNSRSMSEEISLTPADLKKAQVITVPVEEKRSVNDGYTKPLTDPAPVKVTDPVSTVSKTPVTHKAPVLGAKSNTVGNGTVSVKPKQVIPIVPGGGAIGVSTQTSNDPSSKQSQSNNTPVLQKVDTEKVNGVVVPTNKKSD